MNNISVPLDLISLYSLKTLKAKAKLKLSTTLLQEGKNLLEKIIRAFYFFPKLEDYKCQTLLLNWVYMAVHLCNQWILLNVKYKKNNFCKVENTIFFFEKKSFMCINGYGENLSLINWIWIGFYSKMSNVSHLKNNQKIFVTE